MASAQRGLAYLDDERAEETTPWRSPCSARFKRDQDRIGNNYSSGQPSQLAQNCSHAGYSNHRQSIARWSRCFNHGMIAIGPRRQFDVIGHIAFDGSPAVSTDDR